MGGMTGDLQTLKSIGPQGNPGTGPITAVAGDVATRVAVFSAAGELTGYALLTWNNATKTLTIGAASNLTTALILGAGGSLNLGIDGNAAGAFAVYDVQGTRQVFTFDAAGAQNISAQDLVPAAGLTGLLDLGKAATNEWKNGFFAVTVTTPVAALKPMTTTARNGLAPATGWLICNSTLGKLQWYNGVAWETITSI